ncbi:MAG: hypothetical protein QXX20_01710 [Candidatus Thermoplasmatota archaeon]
MADLVIENIVVSTQLTGPVDLQKVSTAVPGTTYTPNEVPAVMFHIDAPKAVVMLFADGHAMITGVRSTDEIEIILDLIAKKLSVVGHTISEEPLVTSHQVIGSVDLRRPLDVRALAKRLSNATYNPRCFPGIIYKTEDPNAVILLFHTGKVVCSATTIDEVSRAVQNIQEKLSSLGV